MVESVNGDKSSYMEDDGFVFDMTALDGAIRIKKDTEFGNFTVVPPKNSSKKYFKSEEVDDEDTAEQIGIKIYNANTTQEESASSSNCIKFTIEKVQGIEIKGDYECIITPSGNQVKGDFVELTELGEYLIRLDDTAAFEGATVYCQANAEMSQAATMYKTAKSSSLTFFEDTLEAIEPFYKELDKDSNAVRVISALEATATENHCYFSDDYSLILVEDGYKLSGNSVVKVFSVETIATPDEEATTLDGITWYLTEAEKTKLKEFYSSNVHTLVALSYEFQLETADETEKAELNELIAEENQKSEWYINRMLIEANVAKKEELDNPTEEIADEDKTTLEKAAEAFQAKADECLKNGDTAGYCKYIVKAANAAAKAKALRENAATEEDDDSGYKAVESNVKFTEFHFTVPAKTVVKLSLKFLMDIDTWGQNMQCLCNNGYGTFNINPWVHHNDNYDGYCGNYDNDYFQPVMYFYANEKWDCTISRYDGKEFEISECMALEGFLESNDELTETKIVKIEA